MRAWTPHLHDLGHLLEVGMETVVALRTRVGNPPKARGKDKETAAPDGCRTQGQPYGVQHARRWQERTDLTRVHFKLADHLDGCLAMLAVVVTSAVHVAECSITHFLQQRPSFEAWVARQLALALSLLCDDALKHRRIVVLAIRRAGLLPRLVIVSLVGSMCGRLARLRSNVPVVEGSDRVIAMGGGRVRRLGVGDVGLADGVMVVVAGDALLLNVNVGDLGGGLIGHVCPRLLPMAKKVLEVLDGGHGESAYGWARAMGAKERERRLETAKTKESDDREAEAKSKESRGVTG